MAHLLLPSVVLRGYGLLDGWGQASWTLNLVAMIGMEQAIRCLPSLFINMLRINRPGAVNIQKVDFSLVIGISSVSLPSLKDTYHIFNR